MLALHVYVAQFMTIAARTVPTRAEVQHLFELLDEDGDGSLDFVEFQQVRAFEKWQW